MQIRVNFKLFLFIILFYFTRQLKVYFVLMLFTALHELAHIIIGVLMGFKVDKINIMPMGFSISLKSSHLDLKKIRIKKIIIAISGPIFNLIIAIVISFYNGSEILVYANLTICLFNLLPIYPLDGGRILKEATGIIKNTRCSIKLCELISIGTLFILTTIGSFLIFYYKNIAIFLIICFLWIIVLKESKINRLRLRAYNLIENNKEVKCDK